MAPVKKVTASSMKRSVLKGDRNNDDGWTPEHSELLWKLYLDKVIDRRTTARDILTSHNERMEPFRAFLNKNLANHITTLRKRIDDFEKHLPTNDEAKYGKIPALGESTSAKCSSSTEKTEPAEDFSPEYYDELCKESIEINNYHCLIFGFNRMNALYDPTEVFVQLALPRTATEIEWKLVNNGQELKVTYEWLHESFYSVSHFKKKLSLAEFSPLLSAMEHEVAQIMEKAEKIPPTEVTMSLAPFKVETNPTLTKGAIETTDDANIFRIAFPIATPSGKDIKIKI